MLDPAIARRIKDIRDKVSLVPAFLRARMDAEEEARRLLRGGADSRQLDHFFELCNTERVPANEFSYELQPEEKQTRFIPAFWGKNRRLMLLTRDECKQWMARLWQAKKDDELSVLESFWQSSPINGAGIGLPTMILYLKHPETYSVWLPVLRRALSSIMGETLPSSRTVPSYLRYNQAVDKCLRIEVKVKPQEIDYILWRLLKEGSLKNHT